MEAYRDPVSSVEQFLLQQRLTPEEREKHADLIEECAMREREIRAAGERTKRAAEEWKGLTELAEVAKTLTKGVTDLMKSQMELLKKSRGTARTLADCLACACLRLLPEDRFHRE